MDADFLRPKSSHQHEKQHTLEPDYVKPKYGENEKICYMDTDGFTVHVKTEYIYIDIADIETRFDTSDFELDRPLPKRNNTKSNWINER